MSLMGVSSCWGFAGRIREGEPTGPSLGGLATFRLHTRAEAILLYTVAASLRNCINPSTTLGFPGLINSFGIVRDTLVTGLWACPNQRTVCSLFSFVLNHVTFQRSAEKVGKGGGMGLTLLNAGKFHSWTQTRNTDLNSKSYSIFVFSLCSLSAFLWPVFLSSTVKDMTWVICLCLPHAPLGVLGKQMAPQQL